MEYTQIIQALSEDNVQSVAHDTCRKRLRLALQGLMDAIQESSVTLVSNANEGLFQAEFEVALSDRCFHVSVLSFLDPEDVKPPLSPRELQIVRMVMNGMLTRGIAYDLGLSPATVNTYIKRIFLKLDVSTRPEMIAKLLREFPYYFKVTQH